MPISDLTRIKLEHRDGCFAVENDPDGCTCGPAVLVQIGGRDRGWTPASGALPRGWTVAGYDQLKRCVDEHQRPTTEAENEEMVREAGRVARRRIGGLRLSVKRR